MRAGLALSFLLSAKEVLSCHGSKGSAKLSLNWALLKRLLQQDVSLFMSQRYSPRDGISHAQLLSLFPLTFYWDLLLCLQFLIKNLRFSMTCEMSRGVEGIRVLGWGDLTHLHGYPWAGMACSSRWNIFGHYLADLFLARKWCPTASENSHTLCIDYVKVEGT